MEDDPAKSTAGYNDRLWLPSRKLITEHQVPNIVHSITVSAQVQQWAQNMFKVFSFNIRSVRTTCWGFVLLPFCLQICNTSDHGFVSICCCCCFCCRCCCFQLISSYMVTVTSFRTWSKLKRMTGNSDTIHCYCRCFCYHGYMLCSLLPTDTFLSRECLLATDWFLSLLLLLLSASPAPTTIMSQ